MASFGYYLDMNFRLILFSSVVATATDLWFVVASHTGCVAGGLFKTPFFYLIRIPLAALGYAPRVVLGKLLEEKDPDRYSRIMRDINECEAALVEMKGNRSETAKIKEELEFLEQTLFFFALREVIWDKDLTSLSLLTKKFWGCQVFKYNNERTISDLSESAFYVELKGRASRCLKDLEAVSGRHVDYDPQMLNLPYERLSKIGVEK